MDYKFECRKLGSFTWYGSAHPARPEDEAKKLVERLNSKDWTIVYRMVPVKRAEP